MLMAALTLQSAVNLRENDEDVIDADKNVQVDERDWEKNLPKQLMGYR
jgi:asparagine synthetase A